MQKKCHFQIKVQSEQLILVKCRRLFKSKISRFRFLLKITWHNFLHFFSFSFYKFLLIFVIHNMHGYMNVSKYAINRHASSCQLHSPIAIRRLIFDKQQQILTVRVTITTIEIYAMRLVFKRKICNRKLLSLIVTTQTIILFVFMFLITKQIVGLKNDLSNNSIIKTLTIVNESTKCHPLAAKKEFSSKYYSILKDLDLMEPTEKFPEFNITNNVMIRLVYQRNLQL